MDIFSILLFTFFIAMGALIGYFLAKAFTIKSHVPIETFNGLSQQLNLLEIEKATRLSKEEVENAFISKELYNNTSIVLEQTKKQLEDSIQQIIELTALSEQKLSKEEVQKNYIPINSYNLVCQKLAELEKKNEQDCEKITTLSGEIIKLNEENNNTNQKLSDFKAELENWHIQAREQFKNLSNEIFKEKSKEFAETNNQSISTVINPFKEHLNEFKKKVEETRKEDIQEITTLKSEITKLQELNVRLSEDADKLANALKSDVRIQGNWGEDRLNLILEAEGLHKYIDYETQNSYLDEMEERMRRPDFIIKLPDEKHIIVDSKVSLTAYVEYFNCKEPNQKQQCLKQLIISVTSHIDKLAEKNYHLLDGLNAPDFVCLFMPIEGALSIVINEAPDIIQRALNKKVVLLTPTTLVATAKMIKLLWQKENRVKNVEEIFRQCGALYDKFVLFVDELQSIGNSINNASGAYKKAMDHLTEGQKKGVTIIGRFEAIKALEAKTTKSIPPALIKQVDILDDSSTIDVDISNNTFQ